jgi:RimJ/RimL family protein N-acetyltransferase
MTDLTVGTMVTARLRLEPIGPRHIEDLWRLHQDPVVATWYAGTWSREQAESFARTCHRGWETDGVHKWMAYHRGHRALVGRGGLSVMPAGAASTVQLQKLLSTAGWTGNRLEVGWALLSDYYGQAYAMEIGHQALTVAWQIFEAPAVISFTEIHNKASRTVAERLGMTFVGQIRTDGLVEGQEEVADDAPFAVYAIDLPTGARPTTGPTRPAAEGTGQRPHSDPD